MTRRIVQMIDLADDAAAWEAYDRAHATGHVPPAVLASNRWRGIRHMDIYRVGARLVMIMDVNIDYDPEGLVEDSILQPAIAEWHRRMGSLQRPLGASSGWTAASLIFSQDEQP